MGLGWGVAYQIFFAKIDQSYSKFKAQILFWGLFLFAWVGAKLLFYITAEEEISLLGQVSFWTGGGFVFYGGLIGGLVYLGLFKFFDQKITINILSPILPALIIGHGIGRIGCFLAGCCFGDKTDFFWGLYSHEHFRHPTQLIESTGLILIGICILKSKATQFRLVNCYLIYYGSLRFFVEMLRGDLIRGHWGPLSPSQWISIVLILIGLALVLKNKINRLEDLN